MFTGQELELLMQLITNVKIQTSLRTIDSDIRPFLEIQKKLKAELEKQNAEKETGLGKQDKASGRIQKKS